MTTEREDLTLIDPSSKSSSTSVRAGSTSPLGNQFEILILSTGQGVNIESAIEQISFCLAGDVVPGRTTMVLNFVRAVYMDTKFVQFDQIESKEAKAKQEMNVVVEVVKEKTLVDFSSIHICLFIIPGVEEETKSECLTIFDGLITHLGTIPLLIICSTTKTRTPPVTVDTVREYLQMRDDQIKFPCKICIVQSPGYDDIESGLQWLVRHMALERSRQHFLRSHTGNKLTG